MLSEHFYMQQIESDNIHFLIKMTG